MLRPDKAGKLGNRSLGLEAIDVADFGDDASGVYLADAGDGRQRVRDDCKLLLNGLVQNFDLLFQGTHGCDRNGHCLVNRVVHGNRQPVRVSGCNLDRLRFCGWVSKIPALLINECRQLVQVGIGQFVCGFKALHERDGGGAGVDDVLVLCQTRAFQKQIISKPLFFSGQILNSVESGSGQCLQGFVAVIVHVDLLGDPTKPELVGDHKGVHIVILGQVGV